MKADREKRGSTVTYNEWDESFLDFWYLHDLHVALLKLYLQYCPTARQSAYKRSVSILYKLDCVWCERYHKKTQGFRDKNQFRLTYQESI